MTARAPMDFQNDFMPALLTSGRASRRHEFPHLRGVEPPEGGPRAFERRTDDDAVGDRLHLADVVRADAAADKYRRMSDDSPRGFDQLVRAGIGLACRSERVGGAESNRGVEV